MQARSVELTSFLTTLHQAIVERAGAEGAESESHQVTEKIMHALQEHRPSAMRSGSAPLLATWCLWKGD